MPKTTSPRTERPSEGPTGAHTPSEGPTGAYTPSEGAAQRCPILRGPHTRRRMGENDTADRVGGENQWVTARREAGMLECLALDVAVRAEVAVRGRRWRCVGGGGGAGMRAHI